MSGIGKQSKRICVDSSRKFSYKKCRRYEQRGLQAAVRAVASMLARMHMQIL